jgi:molybdate-binding protein/DNA-binding XRE family transcriptional regulator
MPSLLANEVASRRRARGLSQTDLAKIAGISRQAVSAIEAGRAQPGVQIALAFARALDSSVEDLFGPPTGTRKGAESANPSRRVSAIVGDRVVARPLDPLDPLATADRLEGTVFISGCDPALALLASHVNSAAGYGAWFSASNREALADFRECRVHVAALHGSPEELQRLMHRVGDTIDSYELATIEEGWIIGRGNPKKLRGARDLARDGVQLVNRAIGSAARGLLDAELRRANLATQNVAGYGHAVAGHADVARAVAFGYADIGLGVASVADAFRLSFIPLRSERCVLVARRSDRHHAGVATLVSALRSTAFRRDLIAFGPYDTTRLGETL